MHRRSQEHRLCWPQGDLLELQFTLMPLVFKGLKRPYSEDPFQIKLKGFLE